MVGKGEHAGKQDFLLFSLCCQMASLSGRFNYVSHDPDLLTTLKKRAFKNILGKGENADNQYFLLFSKCFPVFQSKF